MSPWKNFLDWTVFLILCLRKLFLLWENKNNILNISCDRNNMTNVKTLWRSVYARVFIFTTCFIKKKIENWTLRHKLWKHTWYAWNYRLCLLLLKYTTKMEYLENRNPFWFFTALHNILRYNDCQLDLSLCVYIWTSCLGLGVIMNDKILCQLVAMLFSQQWSLSSNRKAMLIFLLFTLLFSISKLCYKLFLAWKWSQVFYNPQIFILLSLNLFHYWRQTEHEIIKSRIVWAEKANS